ncbi:glycosyltransferase family 9 protein [Xanthobacter sp. 126]|uniref:glycosyltransferase family 9 protein n=1 Tax=Xanthobacter sp. 126 TaxID=1131814 RepID=UPI00045EB84F|nr:glycosyltransferase family 9 protein [Xanthobacter sp. 126]
MSKIVIYRLGSLGDTVVALPFFNRIAELYPDHERIVLTNVPVSSQAAPLLVVLGNKKLVHDAIAYPAGTRDVSALMALWRQLRALKADAVIYMMPARSNVNIWRDYLFLKACGFPKIIGVPESHSVAASRIDAGTGEMEPEVERLGRLLSDLGPIDLKDPANWNLWLDDEEVAVGHGMIAPLGGRPFLAINMGGKLAKNDWGLENWRAMMPRLAATHPGLGLLGVGAAEDQQRFDDIARLWPGSAVNACGRLKPRQSAAALREACLFIGHDSGPMHLASAVGVPCVGLFGDNNPPRKWHPYIGVNRPLHDMRGVTFITVDDVLAAADDLLSLRESAA